MITALEATKHMLGVDRVEVAHHLTTQTKQLLTHTVLVVQETLLVKMVKTVLSLLDIGLHNGFLG
jgi:hypothetical protein